MCLIDMIALLMIIGVVFRPIDVGSDLYLVKILSRSDFELNLFLYRYFHLK